MSSVVRKYFTNDNVIIWGQNNVYVKRFRNLHLAYYIYFSPDKIYVWRQKEQKDKRVRTPHPHPHPTWDLRSSNDAEVRRDWFLSTKELF